MKETTEMPIEALGYRGFATMVGLSPKTICNYFAKDKALGHPHLLPEPSVLIGELPGWTPDAIQRWQLFRPGAGNHTRGQNRRGRGGRPS